MHTTALSILRSFRRGSVLSKRIHNSRVAFAEGKPDNSVVLHAFENSDKKEKETFIETIRTYEQFRKRSQHVEFIYVALKYMDVYGVEKDLEVYKEILNIFPKEKMIPRNLFQSEMMHYPKDQQCAVDILEKMENNSVIPDTETQTILLNIFGRNGIPLQKFWRMMYWMPKFKNLTPWPVPNPVPTDPYVLAKLAIEKISSADVRSVITIFDTKDVEDSLDKTWIISAMSPDQERLLQEHDVKEAVFVRGPYKVWVADKCVDYFCLLSKPPKVKKEQPYIDPDDVSDIKIPHFERFKEVSHPLTIHEQADATIFALCATGTSTKDSLLSWIRCLQKKNSVLSKLAVVFTLKQSVKDTVCIEDQKWDTVTATSTDSRIES